MQRKPAEIAMREAVQKPNRPTGLEMQVPKTLIGVPQSGYNTDRNILGSLPEWTIRARPWDVWRLRSSVRYKLTGQLMQMEQFRFAAPHYPRVALMHFFNSTSSATTPWISTFETSMPRWGEVRMRVRQRGLAMLLSPSCRKLIALSDAAQNIAIAEWRQHLGDEAAQQLEMKTEVLLPPQAVAQNVVDRQAGPIHFAFVGADFYRKGGLEFLQGLARLPRANLAEWRATIIGRLDSFGDYASATDASSQREALELIGRLGTRVVHRPAASRSVVMETMRNAHFFMFPTLADTFGYAALEAQSCGAVLISTNVRALPEINSCETGIVLKLPLDARREFHRHPNMIQEKARLVDAIEAALHEALGMGEERRRKLAEAAARQLRSRHDPTLHRNRIDAIYKAALGMRD
jgi:glycosyltransferase involved in cell wall biosynthesis